MGGGLMQLVAYGAQDVYLTGNPQITFFKVVYRRHTNFACESIEQTFNGNANFGGKATANISRNGDLITNCWIEATLPDLASGETYVNSAGHRLLKEIELDIGGQKIDKHYSDWLEIWSELTTPQEKRDGYKQMVAKYDGTSTFAGGKLYVPLIFFFNRNPGLALPLIALQYHEVRINIQFATKSEMTTADSVGDLQASLFVDYVYLDADERRRFAQTSHEMLIEQLQFTGDEAVKAGSNKIRLNFNHPVKELIWVVKNLKDASGAFENDADPFDYSLGQDQDFGTGDDPVDPVDPVVNAKLLLNGHDRFVVRDGKYFRLVQPFQHHTCVPQRAIYCYSFALKPEEHQPSGTCNFSRIDNATLSVNMATGVDGNMKVFATNFNVLRIMSGMGGLAYSN